MLAGVRSVILGKPQELLPHMVSSNVLSLQANKANNGNVPSISTDVWKDMSKSRTSYNYSNKITNGDFSIDSDADGVSNNWAVINSPVCTNSNSEQTIENTTGTLNKRVEQYFTTISGHKYILLFQGRIISGAGAYITLYSGTGINISNFTSEYTRYSMVLTSSSTSGVVQFGVNANTGKISIKNAIVIDLTALGLQDLSTAQCDELFAFTATTGVASRANDALLLNQAKNGTTSGFIISETINGKTIYQNRFDGTDDYANIVSTASLDITTNELVIAKTFRIPTGATTKWIVSKTEDTALETQYGLKYNATNGNIELWLEGYIRATTIAGSIVVDTWYQVVFYRNSAGLISVYQNQLAHPSSSYIGNLTSRPNLRIGARSSNAGGTTSTDYQKMDIGVLDIYSDTAIDMTKILKAEKTFISMYGLEQNTWSLPAETSTDLFRLYFSTSGAKTLTATVNAGHGMSYIDKSGEQVSNSYSRSVDAKDYIVVRATDPTKITTIDWNTKTLRGGLSVSLFSKLIALTNFYCNVNQLTGSIPSLTTNTALTYFYCHVNQLTGSIPSLTTNTALTYFYCNNNQLTGSIPSLTTNTALINF
ncbi:MAG: hypothetical protein RLY43_1921, partial [Bacteroidota bacterium]